MENNQVIRVNGHILLNAFLQFLLSEMARLRNRNGTWSCRRYIPKNKNNRECYSFTIQLEQKVITSFHPISSFLLFWNETNFYSFKIQLPSIITGNNIFRDQTLHHYFALHNKLCEMMDVWIETVYHWPYNCIC